jgi:hypothetical protein
MNFSDDLRIKLSKKFSFNLEDYVWNDDLNDYLMKIKLGIDEELVHTMSEVYEFGYNIGFCGLTSRYFAIALPRANLIYGNLPLLKGTKCSKDGNHAWIINDGFVIDSTLRLIIPEYIATKIGYTIQKTLAYDSARMLSEYELYSRAVLTRNRDIIGYNEDLLRIN